jgi:universal stress protein E
MQILAATDFSTRSNRALRQAGLLAQSGNTQLHIVHVVDDDQPEELIRMEKREAERVLNEQAGSMPELGGVQTRPMVITGDAFDGILRTASDVNADLIVMGSHRKQFLLDIFIGTTIERVIRKGPFPVLMVNNEAQGATRRLWRPSICRIPPLTRSGSLCPHGWSAAEQRCSMHSSPLGKGKMFVAGIDQVSIDEYVASERQKAMEELATFLVANDFGRERWSLRVEDGAPMEVISRAVADMRPDLLVMGTHGRSGLLKALIGSVTEEALRSLSVDILAVPPVKR